MVSPVVELQGGTPAPEPRTPFETCPVAASLGLLGRRWALLVMRDVAFFPPIRFGTILRHNPGLTPRVLSTRLRELREAGLVERQEAPDEQAVSYTLTEKGRDMVPVLTSFIAYGIRHHADRVFADGRPRTLSEVFPGEQAVLLGPLAAYAWDAPGDPAKR